MYVLPDTLKVGPVHVVPLADTALAKSPPLLPTDVINPDESIAVPLGCKRDTNAPEFIIAGVPNVTAGDGGGGGPSKPTEMPPPIEMPAPIDIPGNAIRYNPNLVRFVFQLVVTPPAPMSVLYKLRMANRPPQNPPGSHRVINPYPIAGLAAPPGGSVTV